MSIPKLPLFTSTVDVILRIVSTITMVLYTIGEYDKLPVVGLALVVCRRTSRLLPPILLFCIP